MMDNPQGDGKYSAIQLKKHNNSPQVQDAMPPHGHGVKDNEEDQSCYKSCSGLSQVPLIHPLGFGVCRWFRTKGNSPNTDLIGLASDESHILVTNKQTNKNIKVLYTFGIWGMKTYVKQC